MSRRDQFDEPEVLAPRWPFWCKTLIAFAVAAPAILGGLIGFAIAIEKISSRAHAKELSAFQANQLATELLCGLAVMALGMMAGWTAGFIAWLFFGPHQSSHGNRRGR